MHLILIEQVEGQGLARGYQQCVGGREDRSPHVHEGRVGLMEK